MWDWTTVGNLENKTEQMKLEAFCIVYRKIIGFIIGRLSPQDRMIDACENITFPQLLLRTVIRSIHIKMSYSMVLESFRGGASIFRT